MVKRWNMTEFRNLYRAADLLSRDNKETLGLLIPVDIYVQDPLVARHNSALGLDSLLVSREPEVEPGPTNARLAVVDYDADKNELTSPARWDSRQQWQCFVHGPSRSPTRIGRQTADAYQFHQVNVWAIVQNVLDLYEEPWALGRPVPWAFEGNRLIIVPHAGYGRNAFYDRHSKSLQFYYFDYQLPASAQLSRVYTCLSHDIIAHETGHAILDGIRPYYLHTSSVQATAFHEFMADLTAITSALRNNKVRGVVADVTKGDLSKADVIADLAEQFGQGITRATPQEGSRYFLRSAHNSMTMADIKGELSPHKCSNVLTGAMFQILTELTVEDLEELRRDGRKPTPREALWSATNTLQHIALQPLDYLPPVDVQFIDYARAVLRAHELFDPVDGKERRPLMRRVFEERGFGNLEDEDQPNPLRLYPFDVERLSRSRTDAYHFLHENRCPLCIPMDQDIEVVDLYATDKAVIGGGTRPREIVIEYMWQEDVPLASSRFGQMEGRNVSLLCGGTLVLDGRGNVLSWMRKPGTGAMIRNKRRRRAHCEREREKGIERRERLLGYIERLVEAGRAAVADERSAGGVEMRLTPVVGRQVGDALQLEITPHLRHWGEDEED